MGYNSSRAARRRRKRRKRILQAVLPVAVAMFLIGIIALIANSTGLFDDFGYSSSKADLYAYFNITPEEAASSAVLVEDGVVTDERITVRDGRLYVPYETVIEKYNENFYWEEASGRLLYTTGDGVYAAVPTEDHYTLEGNGIQAGYQLCYKDGDKLMLCLDYVRVFTNFEYGLFGGTKEPYRAQIKTTWGTTTGAEVKKDNVAIRTEADKDADILKEVRKGSSVTIIEGEGEKWSKVTSDDLITGYIESKYLSDSFERTQAPVSNVAPISVKQVADYSQPVVLAWHNVTNESSTAALKDNEKFLKYINTISPTWFALSDNTGAVASIASSSYVETCHAKGIKVWGLVSNLTYPDISISTVLGDPDKRAYVIEQLLTYASTYKLDGINIDFESLSTEDGPAYTQFIREFCLKAHANGLVVSVDNYVPKEYTMHYNRKEQGVFADYVIIMGYDEHTSGSDEPGSVASLGFVKEGIEKTLEEVPKEKVINALPFYCRFWTVDELDKILDMQTLPMSKGVETVAAAGVQATWNDEAGQNYAEWQQDGAINKIWLEDVQSLREKLNVMKTDEVGGVAVWQLAFGTEEAFSLIDEFYKPQNDQT